MWLKPMAGDDHIARLLKPMVGNIKLNTDGCWYDANRRGRFGGIFRYHNGGQTLGFHGKTCVIPIWKLKYGASTKAWKSFLTKKLGNVKIESASLTAVNLINEGNSGNHPQSVVINEAYYLMNRTNTLLSHIYHLTNRSVCGSPCSCGG